MAILYSEILRTLEPRLKELGFEGESHILKTLGDEAFTGDQATEDLKAKVLQWEVNIRTLLKETEEVTQSVSKLNKEKEERQTIDAMLKAEIEKQFPHTKMKETFKPLRDGFLIGTLQDLKKQATFYIDENHKLAIGERKEKTHPENLSPLDRMLAEAKVSRFNLHQESIEEIINLAVPYDLQTIYFDL